MNNDNEITENNENALLHTSIGKKKHIHSREKHISRHVEGIPYMLYSYTYYYNAIYSTILRVIRKILYSVNMHVRHPK